MRTTILFLCSLVIVSVILFVGGCGSSNFKEDSLNAGRGDIPINSAPPALG